MDSFSVFALAQQTMGEHAVHLIDSLWESLKDMLTTEYFLIQLASIAGAFLLTWLLHLLLKPLLKRWIYMMEGRNDWIKAAVEWISENLFRFILVGLLWSISISLDNYDSISSILNAPEIELQQSAEISNINTGPGLNTTQITSESRKPEFGVSILVRAVASLATLLLVFRALPKQMHQHVYFKTLFILLAVGLLLNLFGIWGVIRDGLNSMRLLPISSSGETQVTVLTLIKGLIAILLLIPFSHWLMKSVDTRVSGVQKMTPALRVLVIKLLKVVIIVGAALFAFSSLGINLSSFAILGGAIGLGLGFGFQKVVSNLISGVILLGDRSIKPGDVIEVDNTYGWINTLGARYVSVITRDGTEHLIPNEMLITEKVVNWSFSSDNIRLKIPFGVSYDSDIHHVMEIVLEAAKTHERVLKDPSPVVRMMGFGENSVDFQLRVWIMDPSSGVNNIRSDLYIAIWDVFREHQIEIPFPQRDLHIKGSAESLGINPNPPTGDQ